MVAFHEGFALVMHGDVKVSVMHGDVNGRYVPAKVSSMLMGTILMKLPKIQPMPCLGIVRSIYPWKVLQALAPSLVQKTSDIGASGYPKSQRLGSTGQDVILKVKQVRNHTFPKTEMEPQKTIEKGKTSSKPPSLGSMVPFNCINEKWHHPLAHQGTGHRANVDPSRAHCACHQVPPATAVLCSHGSDALKNCIFILDSKERKVKTPKLSPTVLLFVTLVQSLLITTVGLVFKNIFIGLKKWIVNPVTVTSHGQRVYARVDVYQRRLGIIPLVGWPFIGSIFSKNTSLHDCQRT